MKERSILFSGPMVRAILDGRKTQTRRLLRLPFSRGWADQDGWHRYDPERAHDRDLMPLWNPYGQPGVRPACDRGAGAHSLGGFEGAMQRETGGADAWAVGRSGDCDRLWVKETWAVSREFNDRAPNEIPRATRIHYLADGPKPAWTGKTRVSIHMPRWASRITLAVESVRVERLQEISEEDARAEGVEAAPFCKAGRRPGMEHVEAFEDLWTKINAKRAPWASNPWVWVVNFGVAKVRR